MEINGEVERLRNQVKYLENVVTGWHREVNTQSLQVKQLVEVLTEALEQVHRGWYPCPDPACRKVMEKCETIIKLHSMRG